MLSKAKVAACSDIRTKHSTQSERHVEFLNVKPWWYVKKPLGFKRLKDRIRMCAKNAANVTWKIKIDILTARNSLILRKIKIVSGANICVRNHRHFHSCTVFALCASCG